ncbi:MAG: tripartite tricarboxylate transporter TctB family protein [Armatimonadota bacterium]|nr:tripartite tricarboxylate transporter TctB family protein [Armatimonadota bacterium]MDR7405142.1 tripartite tricarboxylate transporter TctB family protein [Armatimonadota bacterium]
MAGERGMRAGRAFAAALAVLSALYALEASRIPNPPALADPLGPRAFPLMLGLVGLGLSLAILREGNGEGEVTVAPSNLRDLGLIAAGMAAYALLLPRLGFVLATTLVLSGGFAFTGGRRPFLPAILFALAVYLLFTRVLGVRLPPGILPWE